MPSSTESYALWAISLGVAVVVLVVVTVLLTAILRTAREIDEGARSIWTVGKMAANSTIQLAMLRRTNQIVADVVEGGNSILFHAGRIAHHAGACTGCPRCVVAASGRPAAAPPGGPRPPSNGAMGGPGR